MRKERKPDELRDVKITPDFTKYAEGSVLVKFGDTKVICNATVTNDVPYFLRNSGKGWITAEYSMLPRSAQSRIPRDSVKGRINGRTHEIQRLIGRSLRAVVNFEKLGEKTIVIDADVLQADGGTRTASITGAYTALEIALKKMVSRGELESTPLKDSVAAVSVGIVNGTELLDLDYSEDSAADVDMNVVMTGSGRFIEIQSTAEKNSFDDAALLNMIKLAKKGITQLGEIQKKAYTGELRYD
ncbi:MAG TPA: ribonuclease PH [Firmicutes bacterium]|nr:ribonuclease PH [Bacillota bacterium]